jgi:hypothetical protein
MNTRTSVITDWRVRDENDLPDVPAGGEYERGIAPQKFVVLRRIIVRDMTLVRLRIGAVDEVPFELESEDGPQRSYKPKGLDDDTLKKRLIETGAAVATRDSIAIVPGLEVRVLLRNKGDVPAKPRAALLVHEEVS